MPSPVVQLSDIKFRWRPSGPVVLDAPGFEAAAGERLFIYGPSGSGKTTLLNSIAGVMAPEEGRVQVLEQALTDLSASRRDAFRADHCGLIFQMFNLVPYLSLVENVLLPCRFSKRRRDRAGNGQSALEAAARHLLSELGLDVSALGARPVSELSVGQQQRVAAARALIGQPEIVIADEPTSSLDEGAQDAFLNLLFDEVVKAGATLIFVSHDRRLEPMFDRTVGLPEINRAAGT